MVFFHCGIIHYLQDVGLWDVCCCQLSRSSPNNSGDRIPVHWISPWLCLDLCSCFHVTWSWVASSLCYLSAIIIMSHRETVTHTQAKSDEDMAARDEHVLWSEPWKSRKTKLESCLFSCFFFSCLSFLKNLSFFVQRRHLSLFSLLSLEMILKRYLKNRKILNLYSTAFILSLVRTCSFSFFFILWIHCRCRKQWVIVRHFITGNQFCLWVQQRSLSTLQWLLLFTYTPPSWSSGMIFCFCRISTDWIWVSLFSLGISFLVPVLLIYYMMHLIFFARCRL